MHHPRHHLAERGHLRGLDELRLRLLQARERGRELTGTLRRPLLEGLVGACQRPVHVGDRAVTAGQAHAEIGKQDEQRPGVGHEIDAVQVFFLGCKGEMLLHGFGE